MKGLLMSLKRTALSVIAACAIVGLASFPANAGLSTGSGGTTKTTEQLLAIFTSTCYDKITDIHAVAADANVKGWTEIKGAGLAPFKPQSDPKLLKAWRLRAGRTAFSVSYAVTDVDSNFAEQLPDFAGGEAHSCSVVSGDMDHGATTSALKTLLGRDNDTEFEQGPLTARMWVGVSDEIAVFLYHYRATNGGKNGLVNITAVPKP
jgi:hypothetical protein